jgi:TolB protein
MKKDNSGVKRTGLIRKGLRPRWGLLLCLLWIFPRAHATLTIEITGGASNQIPIAIVPFAATVDAARSVDGVISQDLERSGLFRPVDPSGISPLPHEPEQIRFTDWSDRKADALVIGSVAARTDGRFEVRFRLFDVIKRQQLSGYAYTVGAHQLRTTAHRIADVIYEKLTGTLGVFSTRIAYVVKNGRQFQLEVSDADGYNPKTVLSVQSPILSPSWSPDGKQLAYVSFENRQPAIYIQSVSTGQRRLLLKVKGSSSAPSWSPDGARLCIVLTRDGNAQLYLINQDGSGLQRLSQSSSIDTEPSWSPDGQWIIFTSDRGGSPQIYKMAASGGSAQRLTFEGSYNVSPHYSPDGKSFVFVQRNEGFHIALQDLASGQAQVLTDAPLDESPSFAPNGAMIIYASEINHRGVLATVSSDGAVRQRLTTSSGDVRDPSWGPFLTSQ